MPQAVPPKERIWHMLDVHRTFWFYMERTKIFRESESLFVTFKRSNLGRKALASSLAHWLRACIEWAYHSQERDPPEGISPLAQEHSHFGSF